MTGEYGDIKINGKWYRIDTQSYRERDIVDFSPRAASPGGGIVMSDLMLYQPLLQTDWRHGFGFMKYEDPMGYMTSVGNIDTRHDGIVTMFTDKVSSDTGAFKKTGGTMHRGLPYFWGPQGVRRYTGASWETITPSTVTPIDLMFSLGDNLFACPDNSRIRTTLYGGEVQIQPDELTMEDTYISENAPTVNYGASATLKVGSIAASKHSSIYLKFPLTSIPVGATVTSAKLTLMCSARTTTVPDLKIARCKRAVVESEATWNLFSTGNSWATAGAKDTTSDIESTNMFSGAMGSTARQFFTATLDATEFASMVSSNNGLIIFEEYAGAELQNAEFCSSSEANYDWRPYLTVKYTLATDWTDTGTNTDSKNYHWEVIHNGSIYLGVKDTNRVHYSTSTTLADLEGTVADTSAILVGGGSYHTLRAIPFLGYLYIARPDGLWQLGDDKIAKRVLDFSSEASDLNFNSMTIHNGYLIFPIRDTIYQWNGARLTRITPERISDNWPYKTYGSFANFITIGDFLYCTARTNENVYTESLLCYDGIGWHKLADLVTDGLGSVTLLFFDVSNNYLWIHKDAATPVTYYIPFQERSSYPYSTFPTSGTHSLYTCLQDMGFARIQKSSPSILIESDEVSGASYINVYYALDGGSWIQWGTIKENGVTELTMPGGMRTIEYKYIQLRFDFITSVSTVSPVLKGYTLRFLMRPSVAYGWNFNIISADHFVYGEREDARTSAQIVKDIKTARDSKSPVPFTDMVGNEYYVYISSYSGSAQERNVDTENDGLSSIESILNVNIVEAK